jgi:branched-subunit amino acid transport protein
MMDHLWILVILMGLVTYLPRMLPMVFMKDTRLPSFLDAFLRLVPYAVLGALIFPGILSSTGNTGSALVGGMTAVILAFLRMNIMVVVLGGIGGVYVWGILF